MGRIGRRTKKPREDKYQKAKNKAKINSGIEAYREKRYEDAISYYKQSLNIKRRFLKENSLSVATTYNNLGLAYKALERDKEALRYILASLKIRENILGEESSIVAESYNNLGTIYLKLGEIDKAIKYTKKTIEIKRSIVKREKRDSAVAWGT